MLAALRFYPSGCYQRPVAQQKRKTMSRSIHRVTDAVNEHIFLLNARYLFTHLEPQSSLTGLRTVRQQFVGAIGAIDCSHASIIGPPHHVTHIVHGYHSINVQMNYRHDTFI